MVLTGVAAHEGQLFGIFNQLLRLVAALGLIALCLSAVMCGKGDMQVFSAHQCRFSAPLVLCTCGGRHRNAIYLPEMGISLVLTFLSERFILSRVSKTQRWLGLAMHR